MRERTTGVAATVFAGKPTAGSQASRFLIDYLVLQAALRNGSSLAHREANRPVDLTQTTFAQNGQARSVPRPARYCLMRGPGDVLNLARPDEESS